jgi:prefoldin alpha subunit
MAQEKEDPLSQIAYEAQAYQQQGQYMQQQLSNIQMSINELGTAIGTLKNLSAAKDNEVLLPIGAGAHVSAKLLNAQAVLINIGSDVIAEKPVEEAVSILEERVKRLEETRDKLQQAISEVSRRLEKLDGDAKVLLSKKGGRE